MTRRIYIRFGNGAALGTTFLAFVVSLSGILLTTHQIANSTANSVAEREIQKTFASQKKQLEEEIAEAIRIRMDLEEKLAIADASAVEANRLNVELSARIDNTFAELQTIENDFSSKSQEIFAGIERERLQLDEELLLWFGEAAIQRYEAERQAALEARRRANEARIRLYEAERQAAREAQQRSQQLPESSLQLIP